MPKSKLFKIGALIQDLADVSSVWEPKYWVPRNNVAPTGWTVFIETHRGMKCYEVFSTEAEAWAFHDELIAMWEDATTINPGDGTTNPSNRGSPEHP